MEIKTINWEDTLDLRHQVLWPEKDLRFCKVAGDETAVHFGAYIDNVLVSVASLFTDSRKVRLRKFATSVAYQGQGIGSLLLAHAIVRAEVSGADIFWCDAREDAVGFYSKFGLSIEGRGFFKFDVPYYKMTMVL